jgi:choline transporter-like protein 2/4/5
VQSVGLPVFIVCIVALTIAHFFVTVFEMTLDTIFMCYCIDIEENDGGLMKPYYMSTELEMVMDILNDRTQLEGGTI